MLIWIQDVKVTVWDSSQSKSGGQLGIHTSGYEGLQNSSFVSVVD
ncbi:MAG: hypothetical protein ACR2LL_04940 [Nitrosopumilus sp.]